MRGALQSLLETAVQNLVREGYLPPEGLPPVEVSDPKDPSHGDFACAFALAASKVAGKPPREIAERLVGEITGTQGQRDRGTEGRKEGFTSVSGASIGPLVPSSLVQSAEIAGPGFINLRLSPGAVAAYVPMVLDLGVQGFKNSASGSRLSPLASPDSPIAHRTSHIAPSPENPNTQHPAPLRLNVEFVSVNPNGPITVGSGRGAAFGSTLCNVLEAAGHNVHREYYINDGVNSEQMRLFAESVWAYLKDEPVPEGGYRGDYVREVAYRISQRSIGLRAMEITLPVNQLHEDPKYPYAKPQVGLLGKVAKKLGVDPPPFDPWDEPVVKLAMAIACQAVHDRCDHVELVSTNKNVKVLLGAEGLMRESMVVPVDLKQDFFQVFGNRMGCVEIDGWRCFRLVSGEHSPIQGNLDHVVCVRAEEDHQVWEMLPNLQQGATGELDIVRHLSQRMMLARQRQDLTTFSTTFDTWYSEQSLHDSGAVAACIEELHSKGAADELPYQLEILKKKGEPDQVVRHDQPVEEEEEGPGTEGQGDQGTGKPLPPAPEEEGVGDGGSDFGASGDLHPPAPSPSRGLQGEGESQATLWLRSTKFGDQKDRVLRRKDGRLTYIASDVAYHKDKFSRGSKPDAEGQVQPADKLLTILGPDHHGYIGRLQAVVGALLEEVDGQRLAVSGPESGTANRQPLTANEAVLYSSPAERDACQAALEEAKKRLEVVIFQIVRFVKDGKPAPMRKRDGNIYSLRDLMAEIGKNAAPNAPEAEQMRIGCDVARFFYLMRSHDTHMDFDLDLAEKQSDENPVYYVQYAHARICSVIAKAREAGIGKGGENGENGPDQLSQLSPISPFSPSLLTHPKELALIKKILDLPFEVRRCADDYGVHRLTTYAMDLARAYHGFYDSCRVIQPEEPELSRARLALCEAARTGLRAVFELLGISAPERMERAEA